jgi:hypothetical protein
MEHEAPVYHEKILQSGDVCNSCLRIIKRERLEPTRNGLDEELESVFERDPRTTEIAYGPARSASNVKGCFCDRCGTESAYDRIWDDEPDDRLSERRVRELVKAAIRTLEVKGVDIHRPTLARHALQRRDDGEHVDEAIGRAVEAAIVAAMTAADDAQEARHA